MKSFLTLTVSCFAFLICVSSIEGQVRITNANFQEPSEFPNGPLRDAFLDALPPHLTSNPSIRAEVYFDFAFLEAEDIAGEVRLYHGAFLDMFGGSIRGLRVDSFSTALILDGTVDALNPVSGFVHVDGGSVTLGDYDPKDFPPGRSTPESRIAPLGSPSSATITLGAGLLSGDLSIGAEGLLDIYGGIANVNLGHVEGEVFVSGGNLSDFSVDSVSGSISILGTEMMYDGNQIGNEGLTIDSTNAVGGAVTGSLADGNLFAFDFGQVSAGGVVNLINDNSEFEITETQTEGATNGGAEFAGGVDVSFADVTTAGSFTSDAQRSDVADLQSTLDVSAAPDFQPATDQQVQFWELDFTGDFENEAEVVFGYDDVHLTVPEDELGIYHFNEASNEWELLNVVERNLDRNWIRVQTTSFSPFVLGAAAAVPEPNSIAFFVGLLLTGLSARRQRAS